jgi:hypothetical protein
MAWIGAGFEVLGLLWSFMFVFFASFVGWRMLGGCGIWWLLSWWLLLDSGFPFG